MLEINNLTKTYGANAKPSVDNLSLKVNDGEIFGFIGPNGAGKSTTIKCITGIVDFADGNVLVDGIDIKQNPIEAKKHIGYVSDDHVMYEGLTGVEYINFICDVFDVPQAERKERLDKYAELFSLTDAVKKQISTYSHGMKQKLNVISALIHEPKVWILDEPMTGLDPRSAFNLKKTHARTRRQRQLRVFLVPRSRSSGKSVRQSGNYRRRKTYNLLRNRRTQRAQSGQVA